MNIFLSVFCPRKTDLNKKQPIQAVMNVFEPNKPIRLSFETDNGTFSCAQKWNLSQEDDKTIINFELKYTESGVQTKESIDKQTRFYSNMLTQLKALIEDN